MIERGPPKGDEFTFIFDEGRDGFSMALLVETLDRLRVEGRCAAFGKIAQGTQKHFDILNIAHCTLIFVHALKKRIRIIGNERLDDLSHVTELFEGETQVMNGAGLRRIHLNESLGRS